MAVVYQDHELRISVNKSSCGTIEDTVRAYKANKDTFGRVSYKQVFKWDRDIYGESTVELVTEKSKFYIVGTLSGDEYDRIQVNKHAALAVTDLGIF